MNQNQSSTLHERAGTRARFRRPGRRVLMTYALLLLGLEILLALMSYIYFMARKSSMLEMSQGTVLALVAGFLIFNGMLLFCKLSDHQWH